MAEQTSGADLARQAFQAARAAAKNRPAVSDRKARRAVRPARGTGRDPIGLGGVLERITADHGWTDNLDGGNVIDRWASICPTELATTVTPVGYDAERGLLTLRPSTNAYATQLRLFQQQLAKHLNERIGRPAVRAIRVLPPGASVQPGAAEIPPREETQPEAPVRTRETACDGYKATREALLAHRGDGLPANPYVRAALERQDAALTDPRNREPETAFTDAVAELERVRGPQLSASEQARRAFDVA